MKKRIAVITALVSLMPLGQPLVIGTGTVLTSMAAILASPEKVNAQKTSLICDLRTHIKDEDGDSWRNLKNRKWYIEIDRFNKIITRSQPDIGLSFEYQIISNEVSKIVATNIPYYKKANVQSLTLDLDTGRLTYANHLSEQNIYSFSLHYGVCY